MSGGTEGGPSRDRALSSYPPPTRAKAEEGGDRDSAAAIPGDSTARRLRRIFWICAAVILVVAALVAIAAVVRGDFSETDGKILGTLGSLLLCGALAVSGFSLVERGLLPALGSGSIAVAAVGLIALVSAIWNGFESDGLSRLAGTALVIIGVGLLMTTSLLLLRGRGLLWLVAAEAFALSIAALIVISAIWSDDFSEGAGKADAVFWILGALGWLLVPVLQRFSSVGAAHPLQRVLGELDGVELVASRGLIEGGVAVEPPGSGERMFLRRRPGPSTEAP